MVHTQIPNSIVAIIERTLDFELHLCSNSRPTITDCATPTKALLPSLNFTSQTKKTTYALSTSQGYLEVTEVIHMQVLCKSQIAEQIERIIITISSLTGISGPCFK